MEETHGVIDDLLHELKMGPEVLTPSQYFDARHRDDPFLGERRMLAAAFESHIEDCLYVPRAVGHQSSMRRQFWHDQAMVWVEDDGDGLLSFRWYCDVLGLDASAVRAAIARGRIQIERRLPIVPVGVINLYARV